MTGPVGSNRRDPYGPSEDDRAWKPPAAAPQVAQSYNSGASGVEGSCRHLDVVPVQDIFGDELLAHLCRVCDTQLPANWQPQPAPVAPGRTDRWAVAAFVFGVLGMVPGAIGCGIIALGRIGRSRRSEPPGYRGAVLAIAGMVAAGVYVVLAGLVVAAVLIVQPDDARRAEAGAGPAEQGRTVTPSAVGLSGLRVGDCLLSMTTGDEPFQRVPCEQPHGIEVYAVFHLPGKAWPGSDEVFAAAESECTERFADYVGIPHNQSRFSYTFITPGGKDSWDWDTGAICFILPNGGSLTGPVKGTGR
jgi:hypothetical protein